MPDRKKIKNGIAHCGEMDSCYGCPYIAYENCKKRLFGDIEAYIGGLETAIQKPRPIVWGKRERIMER